MLREAIGEAGKGPGLPATTLPLDTLEANLQGGLSSLTRGIHLLQLH
jgi:hypothetical protein